MFILLPPSLQAIEAQFRDGTQISHRCTFLKSIHFLSSRLTKLVHLAGRRCGQYTQSTAHYLLWNCLGRSLSSSGAALWLKRYERFPGPWKGALLNLESYRIGQLPVTSSGWGSVSGNKRSHCQMINIQSLVEISSMLIILHADYYMALGGH